MGNSWDQDHAVGFQSLHCSVSPGVSKSVSDLSASGHGTHLCVYLSLPVKRTPSPWMLSRLVTPNHKFRFVEKGRQAGRLTSHLGKAADPTVLILQLLFPCGLWRSQCVYS